MGVQHRRQGKAGYVWEGSTDNILVNLWTGKSLTVSVPGSLEIALPSVRTSKVKGYEHLEVEHGKPKQVTKGSYSKDPPHQGLLAGQWGPKA